jgi:hypothetical protein
LSASLFDVKTKIIATVAGLNPPSIMPSERVKPSLKRIAKSQKAQVAAKVMI